MLINVLSLALLIYVKWIINIKEKICNGALCENQYDRILFD